jgi:hypothetical protein
MTAALHDTCAQRRPRIPTWRFPGRSQGGDATGSPTCALVPSDKGPTMSPFDPIYVPAPLTDAEQKALVRVTTLASITAVGTNC